MNTNSLKTFIAVCEHAGFSAAAKELGYTQSTVSSQIKQLEAELQVRLFDRYYHRVSLTEEGDSGLTTGAKYSQCAGKNAGIPEIRERIEGRFTCDVKLHLQSLFLKRSFAVSP